MSINIDFYSQYAPVLKQPGWWETGATGYGSVFFRNTIYEVPGLKITVGIVVLPNSWRYCANFSTPGSGSGVNAPCLDCSTLWDEVKSYYLTHGIEAYNAYVEELDKQIADDEERAKNRTKPCSNGDFYG